MSETKIDLNTLGLLADIQRLGSYGKAAREAGLSTATASRRIIALERAIGTRLLERNARYIQLTVHGERLLSQTEAPFRQIGQAIEKVQEGRRKLSGSIRIATTSTMAETILTPALASLLQTHPDLRFEILLDEDVIDIRKHRIDFALRGGDVRDYSAIARKVTTHRFSCWTSPQWFDVDDVPLLSYHASEFGDASRASVIVHDMGVLKQMVLAGMGEAWLPDSYCAAESASGTLVRCQDKREYMFDIFVVYPSRVDLTERARVVIEQIRKMA